MIDIKNQPLPEQHYMQTILVEYTYLNICYHTEWYER